MFDTVEDAHEKRGLSRFGHTTTKLPRTKTFRMVLNSTTTSIVGRVSLGHSCNKWLHEVECFYGTGCKAT
ncbi:hypothetical protein PLEOSDRAFT_199604 [Pleurotus ostreatus PC15]|uniref:Uncharacterized protein n=1 Tax=Pleurotus ostreatus (strain PC15) TaxID=1137138 RepID=A0A067NHM3_PLEO1|nr:hypothetical protein PLEOSDRAFT_199604 [Pleurotus ostreatus PC15]